MNGVKKLAYGFVLSAAVALGAASAWAAGTLPAGYTEVQYIQGPGNGRIETHYTPNPTTDKVEAVVQWPDSSSLGNNQAIWCARTGGNSATWTLFKIDDQIRFDYNTTTGTKLTPAVVAGPIYTNTVDRNAISWSGSDDGQTHPAAVSFTAAGGPMVLFASYSMSGDNLTGWNNYGRYRLYSVKVWRSNELIHYFVPCKNPDGKGTLVDICDNPTWFSINTLTFTAGPEGHFFDDSFFNTDGLLDIQGSPADIGTPSPAYGLLSNLTAGQTESCLTGIW